MTRHRIRSKITLAVLAVAAVCALVAFQRSSEPTSAADGETAQLINYINGYRAQNGVGALSVSGDLNSQAQNAAQQVVENCNYGPIYGINANFKTGSYGYVTAQALWAAFIGDPGDPGDDSFVLTQYFANPAYKTIGVGRYYAPGVDGLCLHPMWVYAMNRDGPNNTPGPTPGSTPTGTPPGSSTPGPTPTGGTPTVTPSGSFSHPTSSPSPSASPVPTATPTPTSTEAPTSSSIPSDTPSPTPAGVLHGDANCDHVIDLGDTVLLVKQVAGFVDTLPCLPDADLNCDGNVDAGDIMAMLFYHNGISIALPFGCDSIGTQITPAPTPEPSSTPTPTGTVTVAPTAGPTGTPTVTPTPTPEPTATAAPTPAPDGESIRHCFLALASFHAATLYGLNGPVVCDPTVGPGFSCAFLDNAGPCEPAGGLYPSYDCSFIGSAGLDCRASGGFSDYTCIAGNPGAYHCGPGGENDPVYDCAVDTEPATIACLSSIPDLYPDFFCDRTGADFACFAS